MPIQLLSSFQPLILTKSEINSFLTMALNTVSIWKTIGLIIGALSILVNVALFAVLTIPKKPVFGNLFSYETHGELLLYTTNTHRIQKCIHAVWQSTVFIYIDLCEFFVHSSFCCNKLSVSTKVFKARFEEQFK